MFDNNKLYLIIAIIFIFFILYMVFLLILSLIDRKLTGIKINIPKQDVILDTSKLNNVKNKKINSNIYNHNIKRNDLKFETDYLNGLQGFSNNEQEPYYLNDSLDKYKYDQDKDIVCYSNHVHNSEDKQCKCGRTNYPDPSTMNAMDRKIYKTYYQDGMTLQDYVNWLQLHMNDKKLKLGYEHIKYLKAIKKGEKLKYVKGICPPSSNKINTRGTSFEFYQNLYNEDINDEIKNRKNNNINFTKLFNQSGINNRGPLDLTIIEDANNIHSKSIRPFNIGDYSSGNNFYENPYKAKGKMNANALEDMVQSKSSTPISNKFNRAYN